MHRVAEPIIMMCRIARHDLLIWRRTPYAILSAVVPPLGMALLLAVLSVTVTEQPVALVVEGPGRYTMKMSALIRNDTDAYFLTETDAKTASEMLRRQEVAAVITIPAGFGDSREQGAAKLKLVLNNIDIDFSDDIRRSVDRSIAQFDGRIFSEEATEHDPNNNIRAPNAYLIGIDEYTLRTTDVDFLHYQIVPVLVLLVLSVGLMGTAQLCAADNARGTSRLLAVAPAPEFCLIGGRLLGGAVASLAVLAVALVVCLALKIVSAPLSHWPALVALFIATALAASGIGAILGTVVRSAKLIPLSAIVLSTYLFFMGGGFTTIAFLPGWLRSLSAFDPVRYAIDGMRQALFYPDLTGLPLDLAVLVATSAVAVIVGAAGIRRSWTA